MNRTAVRSATISRPRNAPAIARIRRVEDTLRQKTLVKLREAIVTGRFKPDERLVERDVCIKTGVSRSSVREALRYLESEGLVESRGRKGMFVVNLSAAEAMEIYELRKAVEGEAALHFAERASEDEVRQIAEIFETIKTAAATTDGERYWRQTDRYFDVLMLGARNSVAYELMRSLRTRIRYLRSTTTRFATMEYRQGTVAHIGGLTEALVRRDGPTAAARIRTFVDRSARFAAECLAHRDGEGRRPGLPAEGRTAAQR